MTPAALIASARVPDAIWLREISVQPGVLMFFLVPDRPELGRGHQGHAGDPGRRVETDDQFVGPARPEPDLDAPLRGLVLGDSFMQGMFISDEKPRRSACDAISRPA